MESLQYPRRGGALKLTLPWVAAVRVLSAIAALTLGLLVAGLVLPLAGRTSFKFTIVLADAAGFLCVVAGTSHCGVNCTVVLCGL